MYTAEYPRRDTHPMPRRVRVDVKSDLQIPPPFGRTWAAFVACALGMLALGCRNGDLSSRSVQTTSFARSESLLPRARSALRAGQRLELHDSDECVDRYYEAAVYAFAAVRATTATVGPDHLDA